MSEAQASLLESQAFALWQRLDAPQARRDGCDMERFLGVELRAFERWYRRRKSLSAIRQGEQRARD